jgi:hypothetical protein
MKGKPKLAELPHRSAQNQLAELPHHSAQNQSSSDLLFKNVKTNV